MGGSSGDTVWTCSQEQLSFVSDKSAEYSVFLVTVSVVFLFGCFGRVTLGVYYLRLYIFSGLQGTSRYFKTFWLSLSIHKQTMTEV